MAYKALRIRPPHLLCPGHNDSLLLLDYSRHAPASRPLCFPSYLQGEFSHLFQVFVQMPPSPRQHPPNSHLNPHTHHCTPALPYPAVPIVPQYLLLSNLVTHYITYYFIRVVVILQSSY